MELRFTVIQGIALVLLWMAPPVSAQETVIIRDCYDGDTCRTADGERIRLACIDTPELKGRRAQPKRARAARDHLRAMAIGSQQVGTIPQHGDGQVREPASHHHGPLWPDCR